jgi:hypothetical protein
VSAEAVGRLRAGRRSERQRRRHVRKIGHPHCRGGQPFAAGC